MDSEGGRGEEVGVAKGDVVEGEVVGELSITKMDFPTKRVGRRAQ